MQVFVEPAGILRYADFSITCAIGRDGISTAKREGDGATPAGTFPLREAFYRPDRITGLVSLLPVREIAPDDGWCDAPDDSAYNQHVRLPYPSSAEALWRQDRLYDIVVVVGYNDNPPQPGLGSAIFVHLMHPEGTPTEGCVALAKEDLMHLVRQLDRGSTITIRP